MAYYFSLIKRITQRALCFRTAGGKRGKTRCPKQAAPAPRPGSPGRGRGHARAERLLLSDFTCAPGVTAQASPAARPVVTRYLLPLVFSAVASLASHSCTSSCQQLYAFAAAKMPVHSCDRSFIQQNVLNHRCVRGRGPGLLGSPITAGYEMPS